MAMYTLVFFLYMFHPRLAIVMMVGSSVQWVVEGTPRVLLFGEESQLRPAWS